MAEALDWHQQLIYLRGMTEQLKVLHEAQAHQLKLWPFMVDPDLKAGESTAEVDFEKRVVLYRWSLPKRPLRWKPDPAYRKRLGELNGWVQFLLGSSWRLEVEVNEIALEVPPAISKDSNGPRRKKSRPGKSKPKPRRRKH